MASGDRDIFHILRQATWVYLHLLQFCISNQTLDSVEDIKNKPWRPIASGRITLYQAIRLRWVLLVICVLYSASCGVLEAGILLSIATILHNELNLGSHWLSRNILVAVGYTSFSVGCTGAGGLGEFGTILCRISIYEGL